MMLKRIGSERRVMSKKRSQEKTERYLNLSMWKRNKKCKPHEIMKIKLCKPQLTMNKYGMLKCA